MSSAEAESGAQQGTSLPYIIALSRSLNTLVPLLWEREFVFSRDEGDGEAAFLEQRRRGLLLLLLAAVAADEDGAVVVVSAAGVVVGEVMVPAVMVVVVDVVMVVVTRREWSLLMVPPLSLGRLRQLLLLLLLLDGWVLLVRLLLLRLLVLVLLHVAENALDGGCLQEALQHAAGAAVLEALVGREGVLGAVAPVAELADVERVRLLVLVLEVALQRVVAGEGAPAVGTLLGLVYATSRGRRHPVHG